MDKNTAKKLIPMLIPSLALVIVGFAVNKLGQSSATPRLVLQSTSVVPTGFIPKNRYAVQPDTRLKVLVQYSPPTLLDKWRRPKFSTSPSFDLLDETGRKYIVNMQSVTYINELKKHQYEIAYDFPLYQVVSQMPPTAKVVILKTKITFPDGWSLPVKTTVHRRK